MGYTIRDPVSDGTLPVPGERKPRGFAEEIEIRSRCFDASLVIDGGISYSFNDGTVATLDILDDDALRTVVLNEPWFLSNHLGFIWFSFLFYLLFEGNEIMINENICE